MATYRLSRLAEADLLEIASYTLSSWGEDQAVRYMDALEACCWQLVNQPEVGRACDQVRMACGAWNAGAMLCFTGLKPQIS